MQGDITQQTTEAIVNAANNQLAHLGGVAAAIARAAGSELLNASAAIEHVETGSVAVTTAGNLKSKYVIHAVGPIWRGGGQNEEELLARCIISSLDKARELEIRSISFPAISTGIFGYPLKEAATTMLTHCIRWLSENDYHLDVYFVLFTKQDLNAFKQILQTL
jgi:O-acetyl-ADP-ribose deacetylase (regulator of RNase III)